MSNSENEEVKLNDQQIEDGAAITHTKKLAKAAGEKARAGAYPFFYTQKNGKLLLVKVKEVGSFQSFVANTRKMDAAVVKSTIAKWKAQGNYASEDDVEAKILELRAGLTKTNDSPKAAQKRRGKK